MTAVAAATVPCRARLPAWLRYAPIAGCSADLLGDYWTAAFAQWNCYGMTQSDIVNCASNWGWAQYHREFARIVLVQMEGDFNETLAVLEYKDHFKQPALAQI